MGEHPPARSDGGGEWAVPDRLPTARERQKGRAPSESRSGSRGAATNARQPSIRTTFKQAQFPGITRYIPAVSAPPLAAASRPLNTPTVLFLLNFSNETHPP